MKQNVLTLALFALSAASLGAPLGAQEAPTHDLKRARASFSKTDLDGSGRITLREALAAKHSSAEFRSFDLDGDGLLTQDEFLVGYAERVSGRVAGDLDREVRRIRAARREAQAESGPAARRNEVRQDRAEASGIDPQRIRKRVDEKLGQDEVRPATARSKAQRSLSQLQKRRSVARSGAAEAGEGAQRPAPTNGSPDARPAPGAERPSNGQAPARATGERPSAEELRRALQRRTEPQRPAAQREGAGEGPSRLRRSSRSSTEDLRRSVLKRRKAQPAQRSRARGGRRP